MIAPLRQALFLLTRLTRAEDAALSGPAAVMNPAPGSAPPLDGMATILWMQAQFNVTSLLLADVIEYKRQAALSLEALVQSSPGGESSTCV